MPRWSGHLDADGLGVLTIGRGGVDLGLLGGDLPEMRARLVALSLGVPKPTTSPSRGLATRHDRHRLITIATDYPPSSTHCVLPRLEGSGAVYQAGAC